MLVVQTVAKAIAAIVTVLVGSGLLTGHWLTETELILSAVNGIIVYLVPNRAKVVGGTRSASPLP